MDTITVALTGPESCGKSTLTRQLGDYYQAPIVLEYAREYLEKTKGKYTFDDLEKIARVQLRLLEEALSKQPKLIFLDTELTVIKNWSEFKYHKISPWIQQQYEAQKIDLYLLCKPDLPWEDDPFRESKNDRNEIFELYVEALEKMNRNYRIVSGLGDARLQNAKKMVDSLLV